MDTKDYGQQPYVFNVEDATKQNSNFRLAKWTGKNLQLTLMSVPAGDDVGLEVHDDHDQFLRIEAGKALVEMGESKDALDFRQEASDDFAIFVPAGAWHNITNIGNEPLKLYSIYSPPEHPAGTIHATPQDDPEHS